MAPLQPFMKNKCSPKKREIENFFNVIKRERTTFSKLKKRMHENQYEREREKMAKVKKK